MGETQKRNAAREILSICRSMGISMDDLLKAFSETIDETKMPEVKLDDQNIEKKVSNLLKEIGIPAHIKGYYYLRYAIVWLQENDMSKLNMTYVLYPQIAEHFDTTPTRVERAMRHAIEIAWERGNAEVLEKYFGNTTSPDRGKPTNSEFIAMLVDSIKLE